MKTLRRRSLLLVCMLLCLSPSIVLSQTPSQPSQSYGTDRLFRAFAEDAAIVPVQWWEGQLAFTDFDPVDSTTAKLVVAFQPFQDIELGGRVGFGSTDTPAGLPDGSGATDLDVWGKWSLGNVGSQDTDVAVGALVTVPTGDDTAGLGYDSFGFELFGSLRHRLPEAVFTAYAGLRINDDGNILGVTLDGKTSGLVGVGVIIPIQDRISVVGEANLESERFDGGDSDFSLLGGVNWHVGNRGMVRSALSVGITDGAPDAQFMFGYAVNF